MRWNPASRFLSPTTTLAAVSTLSATVGIKSGLLQSSLHVQVIAMTGNLAASGLAVEYRRLVQSYRWSLLAVKESMPWEQGYAEYFKQSWLGGDGALPETAGQVNQ
jgi:hypothetical protein